MPANDKDIESRLRQYGAAVRSTADSRFSGSRSRMVETALDSLPQTDSNGFWSLMAWQQRIKLLSGFNFSFGPQLAFGSAVAALIIVFSHGPFDTIGRTAVSYVQDDQEQNEAAAAVSASAAGSVPELGEELALNQLDGAFDLPEDSSEVPAADTAGDEAGTFWPEAEEGSLQDIQFPLVQFDPIEEYYYDEDETV